MITPGMTGRQRRNRQPAERKIELVLEALRDGTEPALVVALAVGRGLPESDRWDFLALLGKNVKEVPELAAQVYEETLKPAVKVGRATEPAVEAERTVTPKPDLGRSPGVKSRRDEGVRGAQVPETASTGLRRANHGQGSERLAERFPKRSGAMRCQHCCVSIPPKPRHGKLQKFCSPKCRKAAWLKRKSEEESVP